MGKLKGFKIPFTSLKDDSHTFKFEVTNSFFEAFPYSEIKKGKIEVDVDLVKHFNIMTLDISMSGEVEVNCDRCGNDYNQHIEGERKLVVHLNAENFEDEDDIISLTESASDLDLSQYLYEYITLIIPSKRVCGGNPEASSQCDPEMIEKLKNLVPKVKTSSSDAEEIKKPIDPRWDSLKNIKFDN